MNRVDVDVDVDVVVVVGNIHETILPSTPSFQAPTTTTALSR